MERIERFYKIEELLRQRKAASFSVLLSELEVSRSTFIRDLAYKLAQEAGSKQRYEKIVRLKLTDSDGK